MPGHSVHCLRWWCYHLCIRFLAGGIPRQRAAPSDERLPHELEYGPWNDQPVVYRPSLMKRKVVLGKLSDSPLP